MTEQPKARPEARSDVRPGPAVGGDDRQQSCSGEHVPACTVREVLDRVGGKWSIGIIIQASRGPVRFTELERSVEGISRRMLTLTLRNLERDGLLVRTTYPTVPPRVEYVATEMARELYDSLLVLTGWAERHRQAIAAAREAYDRRTAGTD
ncbi:helix-turn-helix domain-containing protein [Micromonospora sp. WMMD1102]|uniref:winged helix-turn-helix transcriptional regulator n=1 Tax=Micromonospora sp. WMMD1102 TaxID=3016105 RepID=UPI002415335B|nr:helix-turn-helix domain-containing protein [Micromonospora sp. WMMD1102]MDG4787457.1 helix-turn-helix domain-containing protein [Micromonospora sp. WMMD1102]